jgi:hypothetical protein
MIPAFASSWITWEALRTRFIRVAIHHKGWKLKDADAVLSKRKIASMAKAEEVITRLGYGLCVLTMACCWARIQNPAGIADLMMAEPTDRANTANACGCLAIGLRVVEPQRTAAAFQP